MGGIAADQEPVNRAVKAGLLLLLLAGGTAVAAEAGQTPALQDPERYLAHRVLIPFRIWDARARDYVTDRSRIRLQDFRIREDRTEQIPLSVDLEQRPLSMALVVDISGSMEETLPSVRRAARRLGDRLGKDDRVAVLSFNREVVQLSDLTADRQALRRHLAELHPWGFTALYDGIHAALEVLEHEPEPRAIVVLTDGVDNRSGFTLDEVADQARSARVPLFFISHRIEPAVFGELTDAAAETGGRVFYSLRDQDLLRYFGTIANGLRNTFLLAYMPEPEPVRGEPRKVEVKVGPRHWKLDTWKREYVLGPEQTAPPADICTGGVECDGPVTASRSGDLLVIRGWPGIAHDMGAMVHPARYGDHQPIPDSPQEIDLRFWPFQRTWESPVELRLRIPEVARLPASPEQFWNDVLAGGAAFRTMGMEQTGPVELVPAERKMTIPAVPGLSEGRDSAQPRELWWLDGRVALRLRRWLSGRLFAEAPWYREWTGRRFDEATGEKIRLAFDTLVRRVDDPIPESVLPRVREVVDREIREERARMWEDIVAGREVPDAHLLPRRADLQAADFLAAADGLLVDRLLSGPVPDPPALERDWLVPARNSWRALRTFFSPTGHQSLVPALPFLDAKAGEIYLQRVILPWIEVDTEGRRFGRFPPAGPNGLELVAALLAEPDLASGLAHGAYRCPAGGVRVHPNFSRRAEQKPGDWMIRVEALVRERQRLREIRRKLGPEETDWLLEEDRLLERELHDLRRPAGPRTDLRLKSTAAPGSGLRLVHEGDGPVVAEPYPRTVFMLEVSGAQDLAALESMPAAGSPEAANALLAARINRLDGPALYRIFRESPCAGTGLIRKIRIRFHAPTVGGIDPLRLLPEGTLELNVAGTTPTQVQDGLAALCGGGGR